MVAEAELREQALKRIHERRAFYTSLAVYVIVNAALVGYWFINGRGYFWPGWVIFGWGIGVAIQGFRVLVAPGEPTEAEIERELEKMRAK